MFGVTILGNNSALPTLERSPTAQVVTVYDQLLLFDCGEGTQLQLAKYKVKRSKIKYIFISHLHGDHYFGLIGLITSFGLLNRTDDLYIYGPPQLQQIVQLQLDAAEVKLPYTLHFYKIEENQVLVTESKFMVSCFKTQHRIPCFGFKVEERKIARKIVKEQVLAYNIPASFYEQLKQGEDYINKQGECIKNEWVTVANSAAKSYAYCADTRYTEVFLDCIKHCNLLYHETTYLKDQADKAFERFHSTTADAANLALKAQVKHLIVGHFSSKFNDTAEFETEMKQLFPSSEATREGVTYRIL